MLNHAVRRKIIAKRMPVGAAAELASRWPRLAGRGCIVGLATLACMVLMLAGRETLLPPLAEAAGIAILLAVVLSLFALHLSRFHPKQLVPFDSQARRWLFAALGLVFLAAVRASLEFNIGAGWMLIAVPAPLVGIVLAVVYDQRFSFDVTLLLFVLATLMIRVVGGEDAFTGEMVATLTALLAGTTLAIVLTRNLRSRSRLAKVGLAAGLVMAAVLGGLMLTGFARIDFANEKLLTTPIWLALALAHGIAAGIVATSLIPALEHGLGIVTEIRLLELEDGNHPLLRMMIERAPGTFMHTQNVARIASNAVEAIGGNALLARVGTLFHDLGKMVRPEYFTENEPESKLYHERLTPAMSGMIIITHVREGLVLARQYKLPRVLDDFITGHHGTSVVSYFHIMAKKRARPGERIEEGQFRYPGPKPQTREAAVVAIADLVEAAGRAKLEGVQTPATLQKFVRDCIMMKLGDGQFDECDITMRDLHLVEQSIVHTMAAIYHHRVKYPNDPDARAAKLAAAEKEELRKDVRQRREKILTQ